MITTYWNPPFLLPAVVDVVRNLFKASLFYPLFMPVVYGASLEEIRVMSDSGAQELALKVLERQQQAVEDRPDVWREWEKERIRLLEERSSWQEIIYRVATYELQSDSFRHWGLGKKARAHLELKQGKQTRNALLQLLWNSETEQKHFPQWRLMLIRSYLADDYVGDAYISMVRYQQDYPQQLDNPEWRVLKGQILLRLGRSEAAYKYLKQQKTPEEKLYYLLGLLNSGDGNLKSVTNEARILAKNKKVRIDVRMRAWQLLARAATVGKDNVLTAVAIEHALALVRDAKYTDPLFVIHPDMLWDHYLSYADILGNRNNLLFGEDQSWIDKAVEYSKKSPPMARSIYAFMIFNAMTDEARTAAHYGLMSLLLKNDFGPETLRQLYLDSSRITEIDSIPDAIRYYLTDKALKERDYKLASRLMHGLEAPPEGLDPLLWHLRRARVFIFAGQFERSSKILTELSSNISTYNKGQIDKFIQVVFEFQETREYEKAIEIFTLMSLRVRDPAIKREIIFWIGDTYRADKEYVRAAEYYIKSAHSTDAEVMDLWGQSAYYQAADMLMQAEYFDDALNLYLKLYKATKEKSQKSIILRKLSILKVKRTQKQ